MVLMNVNYKLYSYLYINEILYMFWQNGNTPLHVASWNGELEAIALLLQKGANIDKVNNVSKITLYEG